MIKAFLLLSVLVGAGWLGVAWYESSSRFVTTENAYVKTRMIVISPDVDGRVAEVLVDSNQPVTEGQLLFRLEPEPFQLTAAGLEAELEKARQTIESYRVQYRLGQLEIKEAEEKVRFLAGEFERQKKLKQDGTGTEAQFDASEHELETARQRVDVLRQRNQLALADLDGREDIATSDHPLFLQAKAALDQATRDLRHAEVHAPASGYISTMNLEAGEFIEAGDAVFTLVTADDPWIEANLKESQLTHVRVGQRATLEVDAYPGVQWASKIESISPATGAEFALLPPQNATGNWVKVVQRVPIHLGVLVPADAPPLRAGMTVTVSIDTERERDVYRLVTQAFASVLSNGETGGSSQLHSSE